MPCSRAFACSRSVCSLGIGHRQLVDELLDGGKDRRRMRELGKHDQSNRQERRAARRRPHRSSPACDPCSRASAIDRAGWADRSGMRRRNSGWDWSWYCLLLSLLAGPSASAQLGFTCATARPRRSLGEGGHPRSLALRRSKTRSPRAGRRRFHQFTNSPIALLTTRVL